MLQSSITSRTFPMGTIATLFFLHLSSLVVIASRQTSNFSSFVDEFVGTAPGPGGSSGGNAFPGAAIPHGMVKAGIDVSSTPRQAGYISNISVPITGISLMHDEGTGGNVNGGYGNFPLFPTRCPDGWQSCVVDINARERLRVPNKDVASPGYFTTTLNNSIKYEVTSTRRAGLERFTFLSNSSPSSQRNGTKTTGVVLGPRLKDNAEMEVEMEEMEETTSDVFVVVDLTNDLGRSFTGGGLTIDSKRGQVALTGQFYQSYGPSYYKIHGCYDFLPPKSKPTYSLSFSGTYQSSIIANSNITITPNKTSLSFANMSEPSSNLQAGALLGFTFSSSSSSAEGTSSKTSNSEPHILTRFGVSLLSQDQACKNAKEEVDSDWDFERLRLTSRNMWEGLLGRFETDPEKENKQVMGMLYSSAYRHFLTPANFTDENPYWGNENPFYDGLFCSWDVFRTQHPLLSLTSPEIWAEIVSTYIDGWKNTGYIPECRANTKPGYVQGGSDGMVILGDFAIKYRNQASSLGIKLDELWQALDDTAQNTPPDWYTIGRQNTAWKQFHYIPTNWTDPQSTGLPTREASRTVEYGLNDFAVYQAARLLKKSPDVVAAYKNSSMNFVNIWNSDTESDGFKGFISRKYLNGTFASTDPKWCSPNDTRHSCARGDDNDSGMYEDSGWAYSYFLPHSYSTLVELMGGRDTFISRLDHYFETYFLVGNEPSFEIPLSYHYADRPDLSALRIRKVVYENFLGQSIPGNDDSGAMAALLIFHLLGLYPVPSSTQLLVSSPFISNYTLHNPHLNSSTTVTVENFDPTTLDASPPSGSRLFVHSISVNGVVQQSRCYLDFKDFVTSSRIVIKVTPEQDSVASCGSSGLPDSLATGGFSSPKP